MVMLSPKLVLIVYSILATMTVASAFLVRARRAIPASTTRFYSKKYRQPQGKPSSSDTPTLDWETFEFSDRPKWFDAEASRAVMESEYDLDTVAELEAKEDQLTAQKLNERMNVLDSLSPRLVTDATRALEPFVNNDRMSKLDGVLKQRTQHCRFLFENPSNPSNVWACLRTIDSFGIQHVDIVVESDCYKGRAALAQKSSMRTAMGSAQWLTLRNQLSTKDAVQELKEKGCKLYASDLNPNSKDIRDIDWGQDDRPICIVMGNEGLGISDEMRSLADETFTLPMCGFAESFNLSVATAITLAHLSACSKGGMGPLRPGDLDEHEFNCLRLKGILHSINKRTSRALLKREGIVLPDNFFEWS